MSRKACVEKVHFEPDGSIKEVDMTSMGFADKLDPTRGTLVGTADIKNEGKAETAWREISAKVDNITGVHGLYFKFISEDKDGIICDLKSFQFSKVL